MDTRIYLRTGQTFNIIEGDVVIPTNENVTIAGVVTGDVDVQSNASLQLDGMIFGSLTVERDGKAMVNGIVRNSVEQLGGLLEIFGKVDKVIEHSEGKVIIDKAAVIGGKRSK